MSTQRVMQYVVGMAFALGVLTACSGGDFNVGSPNSGGGNWPPGGIWPPPGNARFIDSKNFSQEVQVENHMRLHLEAVNGEIAITGLPDATSVQVTAVLRVGSNESQEDAEARLEQLEILVTDLSDEIFVQTQQPDDTQGRQYTVDYILTVPSDLEVEVDQVNGAIRVEDTANSVFVNAMNGSIDGTVSLPPQGEIRVSILLNGNIDLRLPTSTSAALSAFVDQGSITWDNLDLLDTVHTTQSLTGTLGDGAGVIWVETTNGSIDIIGVDG